jgi:hypothetical protein
MERIRRSWRLAKVSVGVIGDAPKLLVLPLLAALSSMLLVVAVVVPWTIFEAPSPETSRIVFFALAFVVYLGLGFVASFFNACVVHAAASRFGGRPVAIGASIRFALAHWRAIFGWALVTASVGVLFRLLDELASRAGPLGGVLIRISHAIFGATWSLIGLLAIPAMLSHGLGPIDAIRHTSKLLEKTWGEGVMLEVGLGLIQIGLVLTGVLAIVGVFSLSPDAATMWLLGGLALVYFVGLGVFFQLAGTIFGTALFIYADTGQLPAGYDSDLMGHAMRARK